MLHQTLQCLRFSPNEIIKLVMYGKCHILYFPQNLITELEFLDDLPLWMSCWGLGFSLNLSGSVYGKSEYMYSLTHTRTHTYL